MLRAPTRTRHVAVVNLAALAILALLAANVVSTPVRAASGLIFVANEWSKITNENPAQAGYSAASTVYSTYADTAGVGVDTGRIIRSGSDVVKVVVIDPELNPSVVANITDTANITVFSGGSGDTISATIGHSAVIELTGLGSTSPIAGTLADVLANTVLSTDGGTTNLVGHQLAIVNFFSGSALGDPWIQVVVNVPGTYTLNHISYETSVVGNAVVTVHSDLEVSDITFLAQEIGIGAGRFEGFIQLVENGTIKNSGDGSTSATVGPSGAVDVFAGPGQLAVSFIDNDGSQRETLLSVENTPPINTVTGPIPGSATQIRRPTFSGTVTDSGSGLKISEIDVKWDHTNDRDNTVPVVNVATGNNVAADVQSLNVSRAGAVNGDTAFSFAASPALNIPNVGLTAPDHIVDWVISSTDLAGNLALSDVDAGKPGVQLPTVRIDNVLPSFMAVANDHQTGLAWNGTREIVARNSLRVAFNDGVTNVQPTDFILTLDSGAIVVPVGATVVNELVDEHGIRFNVGDSNPFTFDELLKPLSFAVGSVIYLEVANDLVSNETPRVALQDSISDLAGNHTSLGEREVSDGIGPLLTVSLSGGSGAGTGDEGPDRLTRDKMTIHVQSDEAIAAGPVIEVFSEPNNADDTPQVIFEGNNTYTATFESEGDPDGMRAIRVIAHDGWGNTGSLGSDAATDPDTPVFRLDTSIPAPALSVTPTDPSNGAVISLRPEIIIDYRATGEETTVRLLDVQLDGEQIAGEFFPSGNGRVHDFIPEIDLALGEHELVISDGGAVDAAGNESVRATLRFTVDVPVAECRADTDRSGIVDRSEAIAVVVSYLLGREDWTRDEAIAVLAAYLTATPLICD